MNKELAEMYGNETESVEKLAAAELAEKLSDEGGLDLTGLTEEQLEELAKSVMSSGEEKVAEEDAEEAEEAEEEAEETEEAETPAEETAEEPEKTAEADELTDEDKQKLAEADYLGRVMAHAFVAEKRDIEKSAAAKEKTAGKVSDALKNLAGKAKGKASGAAGKVGAFAKANPKKSMAAGGAAAAGAGFAAGRASKKEKKGSATPNLDALSDARVKEILEANGIKEEPVAEPETPVEAEKVAEPSPEEKDMALASAVEARAVEKLKALGYEISAEEPKAEEMPAQK